MSPVSSGVKRIAATGHLCSQRGHSFVVSGVACTVPLRHAVQRARGHPGHGAARVFDARLSGGQPLQGQVDT